MQSELVKSHDCETAAPAIREIMGCDKPKAVDQCFKFDDIVIDRCPGFYLKNGIIKFAYELHNWREKGLLPCRGGYMDQPNRIVEICNYMDYLLAEKTKREISK